MGIFERFLAHTWLEWIWVVILPVMYVATVSVWRREGKSVSLDIRVLGLSFLLPLAMFCGSVNETATSMANVYTLYQAGRLLVLDAAQRELCVSGANPSRADQDFINRNLRADDLFWRKAGETHGRKLALRDAIPCDLKPGFDADAYMGYSRSLATSVSYVAQQVGFASLFTSIILVVFFFPGIVKDSNGWGLMHRKSGQ